MKALQCDVTRTVTVLLQSNSFKYVRAALRFMQLRYLLGSHSGINNLHFLLLYEGTLLGNWLQACRETVGVSFSKDQMTNSILPI
jgi:hypothetical protein